MHGGGGIAGKLREFAKKKKSETVKNCGQPPPPPPEVETEGTDKVHKTAAAQKPAPPVWKQIVLDL